MYGDVLGAKRACVEDPERVDDDFFSSPFLRFGLVPMSESDISSRPESSQIYITYGCLETRFAPYA